jgi:hypothetical protein
MTRHTSKIPQLTKINHKKNTSIEKINHMHKKIHPGKHLNETNTTQTEQKNMKDHSLDGNPHD